MRTCPQPFEYFVVLDFEATCDEHQVPYPQEIIEYPSVLLDGRTFDEIAEFSAFVRPLHNPVLTPFCTRLTSITQAQVDQAALFNEVFAQHLAWLRAHELRISDEEDGASFAFVLCGDWDFLTMFPAQCRVCTPAIKKIPHAFRQWINIKKHFAQAQGVAKAPGMDGMLHALGLELTGHHHRGIDDCRNIAKIVRHLALNGTVLQITGELPEWRYFA